MSSPFLEESTYNPEHTTDGTVQDLAFSLDEASIAVGRSADFSADLARYWLNDSTRESIKENVHRLRIRQIALLAAFYIEHDLLAGGPAAETIKSIVAELEAKTCPAECMELRELLAR
jgi:hypothetical protein